ncbi:MAG: response regulator [Kofleriaceae bacterium]|jgi:signal transduction histidine kinase/CheY-like chemotaxis protein|nr:response regulator [Kofleriaceae bacterium]
MGQGAAAPPTSSRPTTDDQRFSPTGPGQRLRFAAVGFAASATLIGTLSWIDGPGMVQGSLLLLALVLVGAVAAISVPVARWTSRQFEVVSAALWMVHLAAAAGLVAAGREAALYAIMISLVSAGSLHVDLPPLLLGATSTVLVGGWLLAEGSIGRDGFVAICAAAAFAFVSFAGYRRYATWVRSLLVTRRQMAAESDVAAARLAAELDERRRAEAERELLRESFLQSQKMEAVGRLAGGVAHDVNNVIAAIRGLAEVMLPDAPEVMHEDLAAIVASCDRGADLTRNLLGFSRRGSYTREVFDAAEVVHDVVKLLQRTAPRGVEIESRRALGCKVEGDRSQLTHAVMNLCLNAIDAMAGQGALTLEVDTAELSDDAADRLRLGAGTMVRIAVTDTGHGIDEETRARLFEPFFTTKPLGKGTGLGLSMVYGTVTAHAGAIDVASEVGRGTTMTVWLPRATTAARPAVLMASAGSGPIVRTPTKGTVLIIDDDPLVRSFMQRLVRGQGCAVLVAERAEEGIELARARPGGIDAVILDMQMPGIGGAAGFRQLRSLQPRLPVILVSGYADQGEVQRCLAEGAMAFLQKPFDVQRMRSELERAIPAAASA